MSITNLKYYINLIENSNFDECHKILKNKDVIMSSKYFLDFLFVSHKYSPNILLTGFFFSKHSDSIFEKKDDKDKLFIKNCLQLKNKILFFINNINKYCIIENKKIVYNFPYLREDNKELINYIKIYYCNFTKWKEKDEIELINELTKIFWELEMNVFCILKKLDKTKEDEENIDSIRNKQQKIENQIKTIGGERGIEHFNNFIPLFIDEDYLNNLFKQIIDNYHTVYWDILREEIKENNFNGFLKILREIKVLFKNLLPTDNKFHNDLDEYIDIDFLDQLIKNNVFESNNLYSIVNYIIENIKRLQSPSDDEDTSNWEKSVFKSLEEGNSYEYFLPIFFKTVLDKLIKINNEVNLIKDSELYSNIKELKHKS